MLKRWDVQRAPATGSSVQGSSGVISVSQCQLYLEWARGSLPWSIVNRCAICEWHVWNPDTSSAKGTSLCGSKREKGLNNSWTRLLRWPLWRNTSAIHTRTFLPYRCFCGLLPTQWTVLLKNEMSSHPVHLMNCLEYLRLFYIFASFMCMEDHSLMLGTFTNTVVESQFANFVLVMMKGELASSCNSDTIVTFCIENMDVAQMWEKRK